MTTSLTDHEKRVLRARITAVLHGLQHLQAFISNPDLDEAMRLVMALELKLTKPRKKESL